MFAGYSTTGCSRATRPPVGRGLLDHRARFAGYSTGARHPALEQARRSGALHASEITRAEVLAGMRPREAAATTAALEALTWHPVDRQVSERAGELAREWRTSHSGIDLADFLIAATAERVGARLLTRNVRHFPMIDGLAAPY